MSQQRSQPPVLVGYDFKRWLGGGGFADVFLYDQRRPSREVAVKVLRAGGLDAEGRRAFDAEANLMAKVSAHPFIVAVFGADTAPDGRPYLVMEYYGRDHYGQRAAESRTSVPDVLKLGVQVASAVEVAHRAGILHRDIKPANILVNDYGRPGLTDFGIAGSSGGEELGAAQGWSVPFAPPEVLDGSTDGDEAADVYSLAATLYTILVGHSPFARPGARSATHELSARILRDAVPPTGRPDVPASLEHLLAQAMAKNPRSRPPSAVAFARSLQAIQRELRLEPTQIEVPEVLGPVVTPPAAVAVADGTRTARPQVVHPDGAKPTPIVSSGPTPAPTPSTPAPAVQAPPAIVEAAPGTAARRAPAAAIVEAAPSPAPPKRVALPVTPSPPEVPRAGETVHRRSTATETPAAPTAPTEDEPAVNKVSRPVAIVAAVVVALVAIAALVVALGGNGDNPVTKVPEDDGGGVLVIEDRPPQPAGVTIEVVGGDGVVSWSEDYEIGDVYKVRRIGGSTDSPLEEGTSSPITISGFTSGCVQLVTVREGRQSDPAVACTS